MLFCPDGYSSWMHSHASNPTAVVQPDGLVKIYFSPRDQENRAHIGYVIVDPMQNWRTVEIADKPVVVPGKIGAFDHRGCSMGCFATAPNGDVYIYYLGWNLAHDVPFRNSIGCWVQRGGEGEFERLSDGPVMDRDLVDPFSISYPFIMKEGDIYHMWYGSHKQWGATTDDMIHGLKYAKSLDALHWDRTNIQCIDTTPEQYAFSRPWVIKEDGLYKMWYSFRGGKYRIGYAESFDGLQWDRKDSEAGITVSDQGWDDTMVCYPCVFDFDGSRYLLYNGNGYGSTGIGLAVYQD